MSHVPPQKCWACAVPMTGEAFEVRRLDCEHCSFHCCGPCMFTHVRKAHPSAWMDRVIPDLRERRSTNWLRNVLFQPEGASEAKVLQLRRRTG